MTQNPESQKPASEIEAAEMSDEALQAVTGGVIHNTPTMRPPSGGGTAGGGGSSATVVLQNAFTAVGQAQNALSNANNQVQNAADAIIKGLGG